MERKRYNICPAGLMGLYSNQTQMNPVGQFQQQANNPFLDLSKVTVIMQAASLERV